MIGRRLAKMLDIPFMDLDDEIESQAGQTIPEIFDESGESAFRTAERKTLLKVIDEYQGVVSLGGGALQNQQTVDQITLNGLLVFIETPISVILDRISQDKNRPLLLDEQGNPKNKKRLEKELTALYEKRFPLYEQAVLKIENDGSEPVGEVVAQLVKKIRNHVE